LKEGFTDHGLEIYRDLIIKGSKFYQFTGLKDNNGVEIYESDLIVNPWRNNNRPHRVVYHEPLAAFCGNYGNIFYPLSHDELKSTLKSGNIHENPEFLGGFLCGFYETPIR
jgi:hypothetical protein